MPKIYAYVLLDPRKPGNYKYGNYSFEYEPYYVGKGQYTRFQRHFTEFCLTREFNSNPYKVRKIRQILEKYSNIKEFVIIFECKSNQEALLKEKELISIIRRFPNGPLTNLTDGGEGMSGHKSKNKGKTYEEIYGVEKARELKELRRKNCQLNNDINKAKSIAKTKGKTLVERYGKEKASKILKNMSDRMKGKPSINKGKPSPQKGKTYEEIYGTEKALQLKEEKRQSFLKRWQKRA